MEPIKRLMLCNTPSLKPSLHPEMMSHICDSDMKVHHMNSPEVSRKWQGVMEILKMGEGVHL